MATVLGTDNDPRPLLRSADVQLLTFGASGLAFIRAASHLSITDGLAGKGGRILVACHGRRMLTIRQALGHALCALDGTQIIQLVTKGNVNNQWLPLVKQRTKELTLLCVRMAAEYLEWGARSSRIPPSIVSDKDVNEHKLIEGKVYYTWCFYDCPGQHDTRKLFSTLMVSSPWAPTADVQLCPQLKRKLQGSRHPPVCR